MRVQKAKKDFETLINAIKLVAFLACLIACLYEVIRAYQKWRREELGTKVDIKTTLNSDFPTKFAYCIDNEDIFRY